MLGTLIVVDGKCTFCRIHERKIHASSEKRLSTVFKEKEPV